MDTSKNKTTENKILKCAEEVFLEKGFAGARTTEIAKKAGVNHAMLHYYFRTKEKLFDVIFDRKLDLLTNSLSALMTNETSLIEKLKIVTEKHFDFIAQNPKLFLFIFFEVQNDNSKRNILINNIIPKINNIISSLDDSLKEEISSGRVRENIQASDILLNIISLNVTTFMIYPLLSIPEKEKKILIEERKQNNIDFIIHSIANNNNSKTKYIQTSFDFG